MPRWQRASRGSTPDSPVSGDRITPGVATGDSSVFQQTAVAEDQAETGIIAVETTIGVVANGVIVNRRRTSRMLMFRV